MEDSAFHTDNAERQHSVTTNGPVMLDISSNSRKFSTFYEMALIL